MNDVIVIGGGIVGLAVAWKLSRKCRVTVLEKEAEVARHQSGRNSGVLHSGIYYRPGSLKAKLCVAGRRQMEQFCSEHAIPFRRSGKLIVANADEELPRLEALVERGRQNGVHCERVNPRDVEPHCAGIAAIHISDTGVVDFRRVCAKLAGNVVTGAKVIAIAGSRVTTTRGVFESDFVINCAGVYSDRIARLAGIDPPVQILPLRGEYYDVVGRSAELCRNLIYPVPDPELPFLGVHFTRAIDGRVHCGPNAVLAFSREGYRRRDINLRDLLEMATYPGNWRIHRPRQTDSFIKAARRLLPDIREEDFRPAPSGVRAQAVARDGTLVDDFLVVSGSHSLHVLNAPSPAATAALAIADALLEMRELQ